MQLRKKTKTYFINFPCLLNYFNSIRLFFQTTGQVHINSTWRISWTPFVKLVCCPFKTPHCHSSDGHRDCMKSIRRDANHTTEHFLPLHIIFLWVSVYTRCSLGTLSPSLLLRSHDLWLRSRPPQHRASWLGVINEDALHTAARIKKNKKKTDSRRFDLTHPPFTDCLGLMRWSMAYSCLSPERTLMHTGAAGVTFKDLVNHQGRAAKAFLVLNHL